MPSAGPLAGIRVIDFGRFIAGPYCGALLADMGADVIRVDRRQGSEDRYIAPVTDGGEGGGFLSLNRNKRSITLDPSKPGGAEVVQRLTKSADVIVANLPVAVLRKMGLDYETLSAANPGIILARISTFGPDGPFAHKLGFDAISQAMTGAMAMSGFEQPTRSVVSFEDYGTALHAAFGVMVALWNRAKTGKGQIVDASLLATGVTYMQGMLAERAVVGTERTQRGNTGFYSAPVDTYRTTDGWIIVQTVGPDMFARWAKLVGREDLIADPRFATELSRADHHAIVTEAMNGWLAQRDTATALADLEAARVPAGPVLELGEVLEHPQVKARDMLQYVDYPDSPKAVPLANTAFRLSETPGAIRHRAPLLGEHTDEVLREIGYTDSELAALRDAEAV